MTEPKYTIQVNHLEEIIKIGETEFHLFEKNKLDALLNKLEAFKTENTEYKEEITVLRKSIFKILALLGLVNTETNSLKEDIDTHYVKYILKALTSVIGLLSTSKFSKSAERELLEKFAFIKELMPIIKKYAGK
jgi:hypothetical protein